MNVSAPHYLLFSQSSRSCEPGRWRFVLQATDGSRQVVADDVEPEIRGERLELLTVVRGLEALDQPSRVTLVTPNVYVREGIRYGLSEWRGNGWRWEFFGHMVPVKNCDLWQRIERAMRFHRVECRTWRFDLPHQPTPVMGNVECRQRGWTSVSLALGRRLRDALGWLLGGIRGLVSGGVQGGTRRAARARTTLAAGV